MGQVYLHVSTRRVSERGSFPEGCVADEKSQGDSWYESRIKTSPTSPNNTKKKKKTAAAGGEHDGVMRAGPEGVPRGSAQIPTQWRGQRVGCGYVCGGDERHTRTSL